MRWQLFDRCGSTSNVPRVSRGQPVHQDTINESGFVDDSIAAMKGSLPTEQVAAETDMQSG